MTVKVNVTGQEEPKSVQVNISEPKIQVEIDKETATIGFELNARKTLNGDIMIFDHTDIDIVVLAEKKKVVAFAKDIMSDVVYGAESRLFDYLKRRGIVAYDSIQGGNVYGSLEGTILESKELDSTKMVLLNISKWMDSERPYFESMEAHDDMMSSAMLEPDAEHATELGEVPHEEEKGSILQHNLFAPYLYGRYTY
tara:strand:+ start:1926 stop:2516 length:591 start_codon:yes stop_codon:yes gene_type:complete